MPLAGCPGGVRPLSAGVRTRLDCPLGAAVRVRTASGPEEAESDVWRPSPPLSPPAYRWPERRIEGEGAAPKLEVGSRDPGATMQLPGRCPCPAAERDRAGGRGHLLWCAERSEAHPRKGGVRSRLQGAERRATERCARRRSTCGARSTGRDRAPG